VATLSLDDRVLAWHLGLGVLDDGREICMGYSCGCVCSTCLDREKQPQPAHEPVRQPREVAA
jgi:hypothetical protein